MRPRREKRASKKFKPGREKGKPTLPIAETLDKAFELLKEPQTRITEPKCPRKVL